MARRIGGQNLEGRFFIVTVPDDWTENDPLPAPSPEDRWFDRMSDFKAALDCPWIRRPLRHTVCQDSRRDRDDNSPQRPRPRGAAKRCGLAPCAASFSQRSPLNTLL